MTAVPLHAVSDAAPDVGVAAAGGISLVEFRNVSKSFGNFVAVDDVSLTIGKGEFFALLGPSGCGKTTLLRMLAGFEEPSGGDILIDGVSVTRVPPYRRPVNMMFQSYALFPHMSVARNIAFGLVMEGLPRREIEARVGEMLALVKLEDFAKRMPHQLSGGQRQRVALARALAKRPKLLLLDEPLSALDKKLREETRLELTDIQLRLGTAFLIVTHDQEEAMSVADRIGVMHQGRLVQVAPPGEIYEQPNSRYVADFLGDINLFEGRVMGGGDGLVCLEGCGTEGPVEVEAKVACRAGDRAWFAIRPEKVAISLTSPSPPRVNAACGLVTDVGYVGDTSIYHVKLATGQSMRARMINSSRRPAQIGRNDEVWLTWSRDAGIILTR